MQIGCLAICTCVTTTTTTTTRYVEAWRFGCHFGRQDGNDRRETGSTSSHKTSNLLLTNTRSRPSTALLLWATSGHDAGQRLQPARGSRPLICPEKTAFYSPA